MKLRSIGHHDFPMPVCLSLWADAPNECGAEPIVMRPESNRFHALGLLVATGIAFAWPSVARAQDSLPAVDPLANVSTTEMEFGPQDLPGQKQGDRERQPDEKKLADVNPDGTLAECTPEDREWFSGAKFWTWKHLCGDCCGGRTWLEQRGLAIGSSFTADWSSVWSGGVRNVASTRHLFDFNATADLGKLVRLEGGTVYADFYSGSMRGGSRDVGDIQGISV